MEIYCTWGNYAVNFVNDLRRALITFMAAVQTVFNLFSRHFRLVGMQN